MDLPELKLPESNQNGINSLVTNGTLADKVAEYIEANVDNGRIWFSYKEYDSTEQVIDIMCREVNEAFNDHRRNIAELMHQHIISNGGVADSYPNPRSDCSFSSSEHGDFDTKVSFNYFEDDYVVGEKGFKHKTDGLVYRNSYEFPGTKEYNELKKKEDELDEVIKKGEKKGAWPEKIFSVLGIIFMSYCLLAFIIHLLFGNGEELFDRFINDENFPFAILYHILKLPIYFAMIFRKFNQFGKIVYSIIVCGALLFGIVCFTYGLYSVLDSKECRRAKKKKKALKHTAEYARIVKENNKQKLANEQLAEQWHQAWFKWCKRVFR